MIIDCHSHMVAAPTGPCTGAALMAGWTVLESSGTYWGKPPAPPEADLLAGLDRQLDLMDQVGTETQVTSPRPFILKHSNRSATAVHWWCQMNNDALAVQTQARPHRIRGIGALPQVAGAPINDTFQEFDRAIDELGFVGVLLNPDPYEGLGGGAPLGDEYWYPLYEKAQERDVPLVIHSAGAQDRENYNEHAVTEASLAVNSLIAADVLHTFPTLKIVVPHGGGSVPYQLGRWMAHDMRTRPTASERDYMTMLRRLWFDATVYTPAALQLLIDTVGSDRVLFGSDRPGSASPMDDLKPVLEGLPGLNEKDLSLIFEDNARDVFGI